MPVAPVAAIWAALLTLEDFGLEPSHKSTFNFYFSYN